MLLNKDKSCLLLVDVQEKLTPYVLHPDKLVYACDWLLRLGTRLSIPRLISEQYPKGLGATVGPLDTYVGHKNRFEKVHFSCGSDRLFMESIKKINRSQLIISGIETHVCVLQTALELKQAGFDVFVVIDAVSARYESDHHAGIERMKQQGIQLVTREMVFFEWLRTAGTAEFKSLSQEFMQKKA